MPRVTPAKKAASAKAGAASAGAAAEQQQATHVSVKALRQDGRWRAGRFWPAEETTVAIDDLPEGGVEMLLEDPVLDVDFLTDGQGE